MRDLWRFVAMMLKYKWHLLGALTAALVAALTLGTGLGAMVLVVKPMLAGEQAQSLPAMLQELNAKIAASPLASRLGVSVPQGLIDVLPTKPYHGVLVVVLTLGAIALIGSVANYTQAYLSQTVAGNTLSDLRKRVFGHVVHLPLKTVVGQGPSNLVSQVVFDTWQVWGGFNSILQKVLSQLLKGIAAIITALVFDWRISLGAVVVGVGLGAIIRKLGTKIRRASRRGLEAQAELQRASNEAIGHLRVVKTNNAEGREQDRFGEVADEYLRQDLKMRRTKSLASPLVELLALITLGVIAVVIAKAATEGNVNAEQVIGALTSLGVAAGCLKPLTALYGELQVASGAAERLAKVLGLQPEAASGAPGGRPALPRHNSSIEIRDVTLTYPGASGPALNGVDLKISHGESVAFVGPNGCGKTTLLSLIPRLLEADDGRGQVLIDGVDIRTVDLTSLRKQIGVVTQETALFKGTIRWNLTYGVETASDEQVRIAARKARAEEFILAKPGGYEFVLGEAGSGLSGGQRQRLSIARAILRDPAILILDEATSMVDADSERKIADALAEFSRGRTSLIVAHRLSTVVHADRIVVMDQGRIVDVGRHDELLARCDVYRTIAHHQLIKPAEAVDSGVVTAG